MNLRALLLTAGLIASALGASTTSAAAGSYQVKACDAASTNANVNNSWSLLGGAANLCPSQGSPYRGITTRIVGSTASGGATKRASFYAPAGTTIAGFTWAGRFARDACSWATEMRALPSQYTLIGYRNGTGCGLWVGGISIPTYVAAPGGTTTLMQNVACGAATCPSGGTFHTYYASVVVQDPTLPGIGHQGGAFASGRWLNGDEHATYVATDNTGISKVEAAVDGVARATGSWLCDFSRAVPCANHSGALAVRTANLPDGPHRMRLTATDAGGNRNAAEFSFKTDNTAPGRIEPFVPGGEGWRQANSFSVRWQNPTQAHAPITRVRYRLCPASGSPCSSGYRDGNDIEGLSNLPVSALGNNTLKLWLEDAAGNQNEALASDPVHLRLDPEAPRVAFLPQDASDPLTVAVRATDSYSGVAGGQIEMRARNGRTWRELDTRVDGGKLVADIDDERIREGTYDFRARASDRAGNEASTATTVDGARVAIRLPVRIMTGLRAGFLKTKTKRRVVRRNGKLRVVRRRVRVLVPKAAVKFGRRVSVRGTLANPDGQPIDGVEITVLARRDLPGEAFAAVGLLRTDARGRFSYSVKATANRLLRFRYAGSRRIRGSTRNVQLKVPGATTISASPRRLLNGQAVTFAGRVRSRPVPRTGKLVEIQAFFRGGFRTISTTRSDAAGRWRFPYRFGGTIGTVRYRFRARLPREGGYPFGAGVSRVARVTVRGL